MKSSGVSKRMIKSTSNLQEPGMWDSSNLDKIWFNAMQNFSYNFFPNSLKGNNNLNECAWRISFVFQNCIHESFWALHDSMFKWVFVVPQMPLAFCRWRDNISFLILCLKQAVLKYTQEEEEEEEEEEVVVPAERKLGLSPCSKTDLTQNL